MLKGIVAVSLLIPATVGSLVFDERSTVNLVITGVSEAIAEAELAPRVKELRVISTLRAYAIVVEPRHIPAIHEIVASAGGSVWLDVQVQASSSPNDPMFAEQWNLRASDLPDSWDLAAEQPRLRVALLDSGVDTSHPDLVDAVCSRGADYTGSGWTGSFAPHGTMVAGVLAATRDNSVGIAGAVRACILDMRVLGSHGAGKASWLAEAIVDATDLRVDAITMSLGGRNLPPIVIEAIEYAHSHGVILVAAAGNRGCSGTFDSSVDEPASYPQVIAVASVAVVGTSYRISPTSSCGIEVYLSAPGEDVLTTVPSGLYGDASGTSMSTPLVTAAALLVKSIDPSWTGDEVKCVLRASASPMLSTALYGTGMLNASRAIRIASAVEAPIVSVCT